MTKKQGLRAVLFCVLLIGTVALLSSVLKQKSTEASRRYHTFYGLERNSLDAVYIGSSGVDQFWMGPLAWEEYGIAVYPLSTNSQPFPAIKGNIREVLKSQNPELFIVDIRSIRKGPEDLKSGSIRQAVEFMNPSWNRWKTTKEILDFTGIPRNERMEYYLPIIKYHERFLKGLSKRDFIEKDSPYMGAYFSVKTAYRSRILEVTKPTEKMQELPEKTEDTLKDLLDFCKEKELKVLFVASPFQVTEQDRMEFNYAGKMIEESGYPFIDYNNRYDELHLDFTKDYYNWGHVNYVGASKYTRNLSQYLISEYGLEDKRGDKRFKQWDKAVKVLNKEVKKCANLKYENDSNDRNSSAS